MTSIRKICTEEQPCMLLLVEDDERVTDLFGNLFSDTRLGVTLKIAKSLAQAREIIHSESLELILLDIGLPDSDGAATVQAIVEAVKDKVPVIVITGSHDSEEECWRAGAADFLIKPLTNLDLIGRIKWAILHQRDRNRVRDYCGQLEQEIDSINQRIETRKVASAGQPVISEGIKDLQETKERLAAMRARIST